MRVRAIARSASCEQIRLLDEMLQDGSTFKFEPEKS